jgi:hypothetical protein
MAQGSKPGERRGGRTKGTPNKRSAEQREKLAAGGLLPLDVMLFVMRNAYQLGDYETALDSASKAAPYVHPRLAATQVTGIDGGPMEMSLQIKFVSAGE